MYVSFCNLFSYKIKERVRSKQFIHSKVVRAYDQDRFLIYDADEDVLDLTNEHINQGDLEREERNPARN